MAITDFENMTADELKARRVQAIEAAAAAPDVGTRWFNARVDAKVRDEKMAEQGADIVALQKAGVESTKLIAGLQDELRAMTLDRDRGVEQVASLTAQLKAEMARANRLRLHAERDSLAVQQAALVLNNAIANRLANAADEGTNGET